LNYIRTVFILTPLLFLSACLQTQPEVEPKQRPQKEQVVVAPVVQKVQKDSTFLEENYVQESKSAKVLKHCFKTGKVTLESSCKKQLNDFLRNTPLKNKRKIFIEVHTDKGGSSKKNLAISKKRAYGVASSLYYKEYKHSEVYYKGYGEEKPLYNAETQEANSENRRIVVRVEDKNTKIDTKGFKRYIYKPKKRVTSHKKSAPKSKTKPIKQKIKATFTPKVKTPTTTQLLKYTGKPDVGWMYFGARELQEKFTIRCVDDAPRKVKRKSISEAKESEYLYGLYSRRVTGDFDGNYMELYPVYIHENGYLPKSNPIVTLYSSDRKITRYQTTVNSYRGKRGILYRIFINGKKDLRCIDLVLPYSNAKVKYGRVYKEVDGKIKAFDFIPE